MNIFVRAIALYSVSLIIGTGSMIKEASALVLKSSGPVVISGKSNVVIRGLKIKNPNGPCVKITNSTNVTIENSDIGPCKNEGVYILTSTNVKIQQNYIYEVSTGVNAVQSKIINVNHNKFLNMNGPMPRGQFVQFNNVLGSGNRVNYNYGVNVLGESHAEDAISMYQSGGTSADPLQIKYNYIRGGGPSASGGGIMLGDGGKGTNIHASFNVIVNPGQYGMAIGGSKLITMIGNKIYGAKQSFTNVGMQVKNYYPKVGACSDHLISGNKVYWISSEGAKNSYWASSSATYKCLRVSVKDDNEWDSPNVSANMAAPAGAGITNR